MKKFNLEEAKAGALVCTRDGHKARIICFDAKNQYPIKALISEADDDESFAEYTTTGRFYLDEGEDPLDLMMASIKKEGWINIYETSDGPTTRTGSFIYPTKEEAIKNASVSLINTVKIEWEE